MTKRLNLASSGALAAAGAASLAALAVACGGSGTSTSTSTSGSDALSSAFASSTESAGTLLCAPAQGQIDACSGKAALAACTLTAADGGTGRSGTCLTTVDGATLACAPTPPAPPQALVDACTGKAAGASCSAAEEFGDTLSGTCVTARDGSTLVCGRVHTPPQAAIDACASLTAGASCALPSRHDGGTAENGVCGMGPASTGPLACAEAQELLPPAAEACSGLAAGAACSLGRHEKAAGTCVTPAAGGAAVCVVACAQVGGLFECGRGRGMGDGHGPGDGRGPGDGCGPEAADAGACPIPADGGMRYHR